MSDSSRRRFARLQELFHELVDLDPGERRTRLDAILQRDPTLHGELTELLSDGEDGARTAREQALDELADTPLVRHDGELGQRIGPYRITGVLGEGGMGRVFAAEQTEPLRRRVAIKVMRSAGSDSREIVGRFRAEQQALAVMDHPNIARMLDAGVTESGQPWFAMELVDGVPITRWAREQQLDLDQRIQLFVLVCEAVQHAHLKGAVHRDVKPSNILVTREEGGEPVVKVIDFGIAKAIDRPLLARTLATRFGELVGTPEYMSPEQATLGAIDVDARSDVYGLGLVLYELLVGDLPLPVEELRGLAFDEICRRIREDDTPRPSSRLGPRSAVPSGSPPRRLSGTVGSSWSRRVRTDLDAVLIKALAKDRERRYQAASDLASDLRRFLRFEAVEAAPPSFAYRAGRFIRRHRVAVVLAGVATAAVVVGLVLATVGLVEAQRARGRAVVAQEQAEAALRTNEEATAFLVSLFEAADPRVNPGLELTARDLLERGIERIDELADEPPVQARLLEALGDVSWSLGAFDRAQPLLERAVELRAGVSPDPRRHAQSLTRLGSLARDQADLAGAEARLREAEDVLETAGLGGSPEMGAVANGIGIVLSRQGRFSAAAEALERSIELAERHEPQPSGNVAAGLANLASTYHRAGDPAASRDASRRSLEVFELLLPDNHPSFAVLLGNIAVASRSLGKLGEARKAAERSLAIDRVALPPGHPRLADDLHVLGAVELRLGRLEAARAAFAEGLEILAAAHGTGSFQSTLHRASLGSVALAEGKPAAALELLDPVIEQLASSDDPRAPRHAVGHLRLRSAALRQLGRQEAAQATLDRWAALVERLDRADELARLELHRALLALDGGDSARARELLERALEAADCTAAVPCALDQASAAGIRAHWYAQSGELDRAWETLSHAVDHPGWTAWMLDSPDLAPLRESDSSRWRFVKAQLRERLEAELAAQSGP